MNPNAGIPLWIQITHRVLRFFWGLSLDVEFLILKIKRKQLLPPWMVYPQFERGAMGWRMGDGESYMMKWLRWFKKLRPLDKNSYHSNYPEPSTWQGFYKDWKNK